MEVHQLNLFKISQLSLHSTQSSKGNNLCRKENDCKKDASAYCLGCYNLYCSSCKCDADNHKQLQIPVRFSDKYNQLMPICRLHNSIAKYVCCRTEMICVYCCHRGHVNHEYENIETQAKRVKELLSNDEGSVGEIERLRQNTKNNYEVTKQNAATIRNTLLKLLRNRVILHGLREMVIADNESRRILNDFDASLYSHLSNYPDANPNDLLRDISLDVNMELLVKKNVIINEYTRLLAIVPALNIDLGDAQLSHPVGELSIVHGANISVSNSETPCSLYSDLDRFNIEDDASSLITQLENLVKGGK